MSTPHEWATGLPDGPALLERAVGYTRGCLQLVAGADPDAPTPCDGWRLVDLLQHMNDSLAAVTTAARVGYVDLVPVRGEGGPELCRVLVERLRGRACALLAAWADHPGDGEVTVSGRRLQTELLAAAGSLEIAVHGWDVARTCGADRPLPPALALDLLDVVPLLVGDADRPARFGARVDVPVHARPSDKLLAAVGRTP